MRDRMSTGTTRAATRAAGNASSRRAWLLTAFAAVAGIVFGIAAIAFEGVSRAPLAAASLVCLVAAAYCLATVLLGTSDNPRIDFEAPPPEPPVPQSLVALIHDPATRDKSSHE
jgi:hypothetical protein